MRVSQVLETCLYVDDLDAAEEFYGRVLGLELHSKEAARHRFFRCGSGMLLLFCPDRTLLSTGIVPAHGARGPGHVAFAIRAGQVESWRGELLAHGVEIESEIDWPSGGHSIYFRDPAGNSLELATRQTWGSSTA